MANLPFTIPDLVCELDLDPYGRETTSDLQTLIQDVLHVLKELPGSNPDDPDRGVGVEMYLNGTEPQFNALSGLIEAQLATDDRITGVSAKITQNPDETFLVRIEVGTSEGIIPLQYGWQNGQFTNVA